MFPSPYGVSFILILNIEIDTITEKYSFRLLTEYHSFLWYTYLYHKRGIHLFPSPYGVSFILICNAGKDTKIQFRYVSVSLRSIIHSYFSNKFSYFSSCFHVSVSLRSIIHSYLNNKGVRNTKKIVSVSLRSIIHSY